MRDEGQMMAAEVEGLDLVTPGLFQRTDSTILKMSFSLRNPSGSFVGERQILWPLRSLSAVWFHVELLKYNVNDGFYYATTN